ncbi:unnamed protein product, partial [Nesidiocoris tenuis]
MSFRFYPADPLPQMASFPPDFFFVIQVLVRSNDARLHIRNVSYHHQGEYICRVWNYIGGSERSVQSDPVALQVV